MAVVAADSLPVLDVVLIMVLTVPSLDLVPLSRGTRRPALPVDAYDEVVVGRRWSPAPGLVLSCLSRMDDTDCE